MTAAAAAQTFDTTVLVHGACYEYACVGSEFKGSGIEAILAINEGATLTYLGPNGEWQYCGSSAHETEEEAKARARTVVRWLQEELLPQVRGGAAVLFAHQTFLDLLLQLLLTGSDNRWTYGMPRHKLSHTGVACVLAHADGRFEQVE